MIPDDLCCTPMFGNEIKTSNFLLRVTRKPNQTENFDMNIIGTVDRTIRFNQLMDYQTDFSDQYKPSEIMCEYTENCASHLRLLESMTDDNPLNSSIQKPIDLSLLSSRYSTNIPTDYGYKNKSNVLYEYNPVKGVFEVKTKRLAYKFAKNEIVWSQLGDEIPTHPSPFNITIDPKNPLTLSEILEKYPTNFTEKETKYLKKLDSLFTTHTKETTLHSYANRPIWLISSILCFFPESDKALVKSLLSAVSYSITAGPFRRMAIMYGYDPRCDKRARL